MKKSILGALALAVGALAVSASAQAAIITSSLGNTASGLNDGDVPTAPTLGTIQSGQPAPFNASLGADILSNAAGSWTHSYGAVSGTITSASLTLGLVDHDSAATAIRWPRSPWTAMI